MKRIGLAGESENDTEAIKCLLQQKFKDVQFVPILRRFRGWEMDTTKFKNSLCNEFDPKRLKGVLLVRDLDDFKSNKLKLAERKKWFEGVNNSITNKGVFLLNIWEIEALILADIKTFNSVYGVSLPFKAPMLVANPKELLKEKTRLAKKQYKEEHCQELFKKLDFNTVKAKCEYFEEFVAEFETFINPK